jgi:hypothetical protein
MTSAVAQAMAVSAGRPPAELVARFASPVLTRSTSSAQQILQAVLWVGHVTLVKRVALPTNQDSWYHMDQRDGRGRARHGLG